MILNIINIQYLTAIRLPLFQIKILFIFAAILTISAQTLRTIPAEALVPRVSATGLASAPILIILQIRQSCYLCRYAYHISPYINNIHPARLSRHGMQRRACPTGRRCTHPV